LVASAEKWREYEDTFIYSIEKMEGKYNSDFFRVGTIDEHPHPG
jgi:hypothetical protein